MYVHTNTQIYTYQGASNPIMVLFEKWVSQGKFWLFLHTNSMDGLIQHCTNTTWICTLNPHHSPPPHYTQTHTKIHIPQNMQVHIQIPRNVQTHIPMHRHKHRMKADRDFHSTRTMNHSFYPPPSCRGDETFSELAEMLGVRSIWKLGGSWACRWGDFF